VGARDPGAERQKMVDRQLRRRGIEDERVLAAMAEVPREIFVPDEHRRRAYADCALPIGHGQTISQPWVVAAICEALSPQPDERVLEIGTGSGYSACVLAKLAASVVSVERVEELARSAREMIARLGVANVEVIVGDGSAGLPDRPPFDAIAVHATAPEPPRNLMAELAPGGRLVVPLAERRADMLTLFERSRGGAPADTADDLRRTLIGPCRFVPLIGTEGFPE
jgi:protein-L-isoaspartate(D-aspartate) O-methyltransferase